MPHHRRFHLTLAALLIAIVTACVYAQAIRFEFVSFDDPLYLDQCPQMKLGLSWPGIKWAFTGVHLCNWHPLTTLSYLAEYQVAGFNTKVYHLNNVILHVANSVVLLLVLARMTGAIWRSALVAALFALHPLHVESVAWVSERKDVLSMLFLLLTLAAYTRYARTGEWGNYVLVLLAFACGLMSKPMLVSVPLLLILLDLWPLKRQPGWRLLLEKIPFVAFSAASSLWTFLIQREGGAVANLETVSLALRLKNVAVAYCAYLFKMLWPTKLAAFYPFNRDYEMWPLALAALIIVSVFVLYHRRRRPYLAVGWAWYLITLVPVIGLVQVGQQMIADRYTYIPLIGVFVMIAWGGWDLLARLPRGREIAATASIVVLAMLSAMSYVQVGHWRNTESLFAHARKVVPNNWNAHLALGDVYGNRGESDRALKEYLEGERINPNTYEAQSRLALLYMQRKEMDKAAVAIDKATSVLERLTAGKKNLENDPRYVETLYNLGVVRLGQDKVDAAAPLIEQAVRHNPSRVTYVGGLAVLRNRQARYAEAATEARRAIELDRNGIDGWGALVTAARQTGQIEEAINALKEVIRLTPADMSARLELVGLLTRLNRPEEAIAQARDAIKTNPNHALLHLRLGALLQVSGRPDEAIVHYRRAIALDPQSAARNNLAWLRATHADARFRDPAEAVRLAEAVRKDAGDRPEVLDTLAAAYAEAGDFTKAVQTAEAAVARAAGDEKFAAELRTRLALYKQGKPYHE